MRRLLCLILLVALPACRPGVDSGAVERAKEEKAEQEGKAATAREEDKLLKALEHTRNMAREASAFTLYQVANELDERYDSLKVNARVAGYPILGKQTLTRERAAALIDSLTFRSAYFPPGDGWACIFRPHHVLELASKADTQDIVICLACGDILFYTPGKEGVLKSLTIEGHVSVASSIYKIDPDAAPKRTSKGNSP